MYMKKMTKSQIKYVENQYKKSLKFFEKNKLNSTYTNETKSSKISITEFYYDYLVILEIVDPLYNSINEKLALVLNTKQGTFIYDIYNKSDMINFFETEDDRFIDNIYEEQLKSEENILESKEEIEAFFVECYSTFLKEKYKRMYNSFIKSVSERIL